MKIKRTLLIFVLSLMMIALFLVAFSACEEGGVLPLKEDCLHQWEDWITILNPTCTEEGLQSRRCSECGGSEIAALAALGHNEEGTVAHKDATCTETGVRGGSYCTRCNKGRFDAETILSALGHNTDGRINSVEPTCTKAGVVGGLYCSRCNYGKESAEAPINALGHNTDNWVLPVAATCTDSGRVGGHYCSRCGEGEEEVLEVIPALGHDEAGTVAHKDPTCTQAGVVGGNYCSRCGEGKQEAEAAITALGHTEVIDQAVEATFSFAGLTAGSHCSVCQTTLVEQVEIPALREGGSNQKTVLGSEYLDDEGGVTYRYRYYLTVETEESFSLTTLTIGSDDSYSMNCSEGAFVSLGDDVYELRFDEDRDSMFVKFINGGFSFCNEDGSPWGKQKVERPKGVTTVDLTPRQGNSVYGYYDLANNTHGEAMQELYRKLFDACESFADDTGEVQVADGLYLLESVDLSRYVITFDEVLAVWKVFLVENPVYYWLSNGVTVDGDFLRFCIDEAYAQGDYRAQCDAVIEEMTQACAALIDEDTSELQIAMTVHDFIIDRMDYAYKEDGVTPQDAVWAHNMVGCAAYSLGVCESYAETFAYLCRLFGLDAIIVTGTANDESHAWNLVKINDVWYAVDVTWDETNQKEISYNCFGMAASFCESTHDADGVEKAGIEYLYELPEISERPIELVKLKENDEYIGTYANIDEAFEIMTDQNADYTVELYSYRMQGPLLLSSPDIVHSILSTETPVVKSITIKGEYLSFAGGYGTCSAITILNSLTLLSERLILCDIRPRGEYPLYLLDNCLEITGNFSYVHIPIVGNVEEGATSKIICDTDSGTGVEFYDSVEVNEVRSETGVKFRHNTIIKHLRSKIANFMSSHAEIENLYGIFEYCTVGLEENTDVTIRNLYSDAPMIRFFFTFGKLEAYPLLTLGNIDCQVEIDLLGHVAYSITDMSGNEVGRYEENVNPFNLNQPIARLLNLSDFDKIGISYTNQGWKTAMYEVNEVGEIVLKEYEIKNDFVIMENTVVFYVGSALFFDIPEGITEIQPYAFYSCRSLLRVTLPKTLSLIGENAFADCTSLIEVCNKSDLDIVAGSWDNGFVAREAKRVITDESQSAVRIIGDYVFYDDGESAFLIRYLGTEAEILLPDYEGKPYTIAEYAFDANQDLIVVTIPSNVTEIEIHAFSDCDSLEKVFIPSSVLTMGLEAFGGCDKVTLYCEAEEKPAGWDKDWDEKYLDGPDAVIVRCDVVWGYDLQSEQA